MGNAGKVGRDTKIRRQLTGGAASSIESISFVDHEARDEPEGLAELIAMSGEALDTNDEEFDPSFDRD